jgi:pyridoxamine 5'-phosphate oxidase
MIPNIEALRQDYRLASLEVSDVGANPFLQFKKWFQEALDAQLPEPNAMTLATATPEGKPTLRVVLLKGFDENGFVFYTNYESRKGQELQANPYAALNFLWLELERQVRIEGKAIRVSNSESTAYFKSRPKGSQIGAWASPQSTVIPDRQVLEEKVQELMTTYENTEVLPRPEHWGGFIVIPDLIEFWQGRSSRLHDRIRYTLQADESWKIERLAP